MPQEELKDIKDAMSELPETMAYVLIRGGKAMACSIPEGVDEVKLISSIVASVKAYEELSGRLEIGRMQQTLISFEGAIITILDVEDGTILMAVTRREQGLGRVLLEIENVAYKIQRTLRSEGVKGSE